MLPRPFETYRGSRMKDGSVRVHVGGLPVDPRNDIRNHSPDGFEWGYCGSGPAQLALGILCDAVGAVLGEVLYQDFKREVVATWSKAKWSITKEEVQEWVLAALCKPGSSRLARAHDLLREKKGFYDEQREERQERVGDAGT